MTAPLLPILGFIGGLGPLEISLILVVALLLFGKRVPEVARSLGKGIVEFKRGVRGIEDEVDEASRESSSNIQPPAGPGAPSETKSPEHSANN